MTFPRTQITLIFVLISLVTVCAKAYSGFHGTGGYHYGHSGHSEVTGHYAYYSYHPPQYVKFMCRHCANNVLYPVYHSSLPTYVYKFRASSSRYGLLLAGLSLYNLGRCCRNPNAKANVYTARIDEHCSLQIVDRDHDSFEEAGFPCFMMSSFMERKNQSSAPLSVASLNRNSTIGASNNESITVDIETANIDVRPYLTSNESQLAVTYDQQCVIWHNMTTNKEKHNVPCELLEKYAKTLKSTGVPVYIWLPTMIFIIAGLYIICYCCRCKKQKEKKEVIPLNQGEVYRYCSNNN